MDRRSKRGKKSSLGRMTGSTSSSPPKRSITPISQTKEEREGAFKDWIFKLDNVLVFLESAAYDAQVRAAEAVAALLRNELAEGKFNDPPLSPLSAALGTTDRAPGKSSRALMTLAKHVIVTRPKAARVKKATKGGNRPGTFTGKYEPATVGFKKDFQHIAFELDQGAIRNVPAGLARKLMEIAKIKSGWEKIGNERSPSVMIKDTEGNEKAHKVWIVEGRNFSSVLVSAEAEERVRRVAEAAFGGKNGQTDVEHWEDILKDVNSGMGEGTGSFDNIDDFSGGNSGALDWDSLNGSGNALDLLTSRDRFGRID